MKNLLFLACAVVLSSFFFFEKTPPKISPADAPSIPFCTSDPLFFALQNAPAWQPPTTKRTNVVRHDISKMKANDPVVVALKKAITTMKARPATDPTSWTYQANMHGTFTKPFKKGWGSCQHRSAFFLSWHRMYLYFFERILQKAAADSTLGLPFWDYSTVGQRALPLVCRQPADKSNPLFVKQRDLDMNDGATLPPSSYLMSDVWAATDMTINTPTNASFSKRIEMGPHGDVHNVVGGEDGGYMASLENAAKDPVFWLHHCNIDRLWAKWTLEKKEPFPTNDSDWMNKKFVFFDENGQEITMTGKDVIDFSSKLGYEYEGLPLDALATKTMMRPPSKARPDSLIQNVTQQAKKATARGPKTKISLKKNPIPPKTNRAVGQPPSAYVLVLKNISAKKLPSGVYEVYLNLPDDVKTPDFESVFYAGNLNLFALEAENEQRLNVTKVVQALQTKGISTSELSVTLFQRQPELPAGVKSRKKKSKSLIEISDIELVEVD